METSMKELKPAMRQAFERIANMKLLNVAGKDIAGAMGVSEAAISKIIKMDSYKGVYEELAGERFEKLQSVNNDWDTVESLAIKNVKTYLEWGNDPEFNLRAAAVANRAQRRGQNLNNEPLPASLGSRVNIQLSQIFVDKLQQVNVVEEAALIANGQDLAIESATGETSKFKNVLSPKSARKLFGGSNEPDKIKGMVDALFSAQSLVSVG